MVKAILLGCERVAFLRSSSFTLKVRHRKLVAIVIVQLWNYILVVEEYRTDFCPTNYIMTVMVIGLSLPVLKATHLLLDLKIAYRK